jgi:hypothetical protein
MSSEYYQYDRRTIGDFFSDVKTKGFGKAWNYATDWGQMRMLPTDLSDVTNYTFLMNGKTPDQNWTALFKKGERVRQGRSKIRPKGGVKVYHCEHA